MEWVDQDVALQPGGERRNEQQRTALLAIPGLPEGFADRRVLRVPARMPCGLKHLVVAAVAWHRQPLRCPFHELFGTRAAAGMAHGRRSGSPLTRPDRSRSSPGSGC